MRSNIYDYDGNYDEEDKPTKDIFWMYHGKNFAQSGQHFHSNDNNRHDIDTPFAGDVTRSYFKRTVPQDIHSFGSSSLDNYSSRQLINSSKKTKPATREIIQTVPSLRFCETETTMINKKI